MSANNLGLVARMRAQRSIHIELLPGVTVTALRPAEGEMPEFMRLLDARDAYAVCTRWVTGWDGMTEERLLGAGVGGQIAVPFDPAVWAEAVLDHRDWLTTICTEMVKAVNAHGTAKAVAQGKSPDTSTPSEASSGKATTDPSPTSLTP